MKHRYLPMTGAPLETATRSVSEAAATGTNINSTVDGDDTPVAATDEDRPMQSLTYTLSGTDATSFAIVPTTGQLQTRAALDYETKTDYEVTVTASDGTLSSDPITVTITVIDDVTDGDTAVVNSVPFFNEGPRTTREVNENAEKGEDIRTAWSPPVPVTPVEATDYTPGTVTPSRDTLTYAFDETAGDDSDLFAIVADSGQLQTKAKLDHETKSSYMVVVTVTDGRDAENNVDTTVDDTIMVTMRSMDVNEAPEFAAKTATREVAENTVADTNIGAPVTAMDEDSGDTLMYAFDPDSTIPLRLPLCQPLGS